MESGADPRIVDVEKLTDKQPFCAGVIWIRGGKMAVTLNVDGIPPKLGGGVFRIGGVGGGQEPGETIRQCALREAKEELGTAEVKLVSADRTYFHDMDTDEIVRMESTDNVAPFLLQRRTNPHPTKPYKPGLPTGPYIYYGTYIAEADRVQTNPDDDVAGVLFVPLGSLHMLEEMPTLSRMLEAGAELFENVPLSSSAVLWMPENESLRTIRKLWSKQADIR